MFTSKRRLIAKSTLFLTPEYYTLTVVQYKNGEYCFIANSKRTAGETSQMVFRGNEAE